MRLLYIVTVDSLYIIIVMYIMYIMYSLLSLDIHIMYSIRRFVVLDILD